MSIVLERLSKRFGTQPIVDDVSLDIRDGELFVLLGASGSGKSTILRIIAGLLQADTGRVLLHDRDVTYVPPQRRDIGFVFQNYSIFRHMTVAENIQFGLRLRKVPRSERMRRCEELLDLVDLAGMGERLPQQLSGGQQQRVALARALAYEPKVLLLDEPFGALDVKIRGQLRRSLRQIQRKLGVTTILVTHDQEEAFELADRIGVIDRGRLLEVGESEQLYFRPQSDFVATFLGAGTVIVGQVREDRAWFGDLRLPLDAASECEDGGRIQLLVRPEQVLLSDRFLPEQPAHVGRGVVTEEYFTGALRKARLRLGHLQGTRQISPPPSFGEDALLVDAVAEGSRSIAGKEFHVYFRDWHIINAPPWKILVLGRSEERPEPPPPLVDWLLAELRASATFLPLDGDLRSLVPPTDGESLRARTASFEHLRHVGADHLGPILLELGKSLHDLVVVETDGAAGPAGKQRWFDLASRLVRESRLPVLLARGNPSGVRTMLICTDAGESGKHDVRHGGRLARRLGSEVRLLHVAEEGTNRTLARAHLSGAEATLRSLDLDVTSEIREGRAVGSTIVEEADRRSCDLIVVGEHLAQSRLFGDGNVTRAVVLGSDRPILIVPVDD